MKGFEKNRHSEAEKLKKSPDQKSREIKSINFTKLYFSQNPFFCNFKNGENQFLN